MTMTVKLCRISPGMDPLSIVDAHVAAYEDLCEEVLGPEYEEHASVSDHVMTEFKARAALLLEEFGFDSCGYLKCVKPLDQIKSQLHPDHPFRVDYWFSGPTPRSLNNVILRHTGEDLRFVFDVSNSFYERPNWEKAQEEVGRIKMALEEAYIGVDVYEASPNPFRDTETLSHAGAVLDFYASRQYELSDDVSGTVFEIPLTVRAVFHGHSSYMSGEPATYLVHDWTREHLQWYLDALDVVQEQLHYVLEQPDPENFILQWCRDEGLGVVE